MYERHASIRSERMQADGVIEGTLATNGEASDGHILDIAGLEVRDGAPLLFNHDASTGRNNLGSWVTFKAMGPGTKRMAELGDQQLHGVAQIEMAGEGEQLKFRQDTAHMIEQGHIRSFSVRWMPGDEAPVARSSLPKGHPAFSEERQAGLYFPSSRLLEGSVVTIGADAQAVMRHLEEASDRSRWIEAIGGDELERLIEEVESERVRRAQRDRIDAFFASKTVTGDVQPERAPEEVAPLPTEEAPADEPAPVPMSAAEVLSLMVSKLDGHESRIRARCQAMLDKAVGRV